MRVRVCVPQGGTAEHGTAGLVSAVNGAVHHGMSDEQLLALCSKLSGGTTTGGGGDMSEEELAALNLALDRELHAHR